MMRESTEKREPDYEKAELDLLRDALQKTHEERFKTMTLLMKKTIMFRNAKVGHSQFTSKKMNMNQEGKKNILSEPQQNYGFGNKTEDDKLLENMNRPYKEKLQLFTQMLRRNKLLERAIITSKL